MKQTLRIITCWKNKNDKATRYSTLACNDEETIIKWLYQQGIRFYGCWGVECHDIGDTDYFSGSINTEDVDAILKFVDKLYGEWHLCATYKGIDIQIDKQYPNITNGLSFKYQKDCEDVVLRLLGEFEINFCFPEIKEWTDVR